MYRGVPYAKSVNRFEHAQAVESWDLRNAKEAGPACYQLMANMIQAKGTTEFKVGTIIIFQNLA